jgi:transposase-like protein
MAIEWLTRSPLKWQSNGKVEARKARDVARKPQGELARKLAARAYEGRSALYRWTRQHFAELRAARAAYKPTWQAIADLAAEAGQVDRANKPPSAAAMRKIYLRVEGDIEADRRVASRPLARARSASPRAAIVTPAVGERPDVPIKPATPEGQNARPEPGGRTGFRHDGGATGDDKVRLFGVPPAKQ